jgi:hypothetical protein
VFRIAVFVSLAFVALSVGHQKHLLQRAALVGTCTPVQVSGPAAPDVAWRSCRSGRLTGAPDLSARCTAAGTTAKTQLWRCPVTSYAAAP